MSIAARTARARGGRSPVALALVLLFIAFNATVDLYWGRHAHELPALAAQGAPIARVFQSFAVADRGYFDHVTKAELGLYILNSTLTLGLLLCLFAALLRRWRIRVPLQIITGGCMAYQVLSYWWCALLGGFPAMDEKTLGHFALFVAGGLPWLLGGGYLAWDGAKVAVAALERLGGGSGLRNLGANERASLSVIAFFAVIAYTLELLWLYHAFDWPLQTGFWANMARYYGMGDRAYWDQPSYFEVGLESFNVFFIVSSELWLGYAILRRRAYRWPLELCIGGFLTYSVIYYFTVKIAFPQMFTQDIASYAMLIVPNLPWLFGGAWWIWDAGGTILKAVRGAD
jgi:hypothetical protein